MGGQEHNCTNDNADRDAAFYDAIVADPAKEKVFMETLHHREKHSAEMDRVESLDLSAKDWAGYTWLMAVYFSETRRIVVPT